MLVPRARAMSAPVQSILDALLVAELVSIAAYHAALTNVAIVHDTRLGGPGADPHRPDTWMGGIPAHMKDMLSILDAEVKHASALRAAGARAPVERAYLPRATMARLGSIAEPGSFLATMDTLERTAAAAYLAAAAALFSAGQPVFATTLARIMGVEAEHRLLCRLVDGTVAVSGRPLPPSPPPDTVAFTHTALAPYLTAGPGKVAVGVPPVAATRALVGVYATRIVTSYP